MSESNEEAVFRSTKTEKAPGGGSTTTTTTTTKQTSKDGSTTTVKQSKQVTQSGGPGSTNITITKTSAGNKLYLILDKTNLHTSLPTLFQRFGFRMVDTEICRFH